MVRRSTVDRSPPPSMYDTNYEAGTRKLARGELQAVALWHRMAWRRRAPADVGVPCSYVGGPARDRVPAT